MDADGGRRTNLTNHPADDASFSWSPDGRHILFSSDRDGNLEIYVMNADGSGQVALGFVPLIFSSLIPYVIVGLLLSSIMILSWLGTMVAIPAIITSAAAGCDRLAGQKRRTKDFI